MVQRSIASSAERGAASLAAERLDAFGLAMLAIPNQSVDSSVSVAKVLALPVRTGEPFGGYALGGSPPAFDLAPGTHRSRYCSSTQRGSRGESTGGTIVGGARLEQSMERHAHRGLCSGPDKTMMGKAVGTQQRQSEDEHDHEQKHLEVHEAFSLLEMSRRGPLFLRSKNKGPQEGKSSR